MPDLADVQICPSCHQRIEVIPDQVVFSIKCAAFEGGIGYWCYIAPTATAGCDKDLNYIGDFLIGEFDETTRFVTRDYVLTDDLLRNGIRARAASRGLSVEQWFEKRNAGEADCAVQLAIFGEVRYR
jgi:hypothetical protein